MSDRGGGRGGRGKEKELVSNLVFYAHSTSISGGVKREREKKKKKKDISWPVYISLDYRQLFPVLTLLLLSLFTLLMVNPVDVCDDISSVQSTQALQSIGRR